MSKYPSIELVSLTPHIGAQVSWRRLVETVVERIGA